MNPITLHVTAIFGAIGAGLFLAQMMPAAAGFIALAVLTFFSLKMANNWERFVILRAGKLSSVKGPGLFVIVPIIDSDCTQKNRRKLRWRKGLKREAKNCDMKIEVTMQGRKS